MARDAFKRRKYPVFCEMRCLRIRKRRCATVFFMRGAHEMLINARMRARKTTSAMMENTMRADTYRFAINSFADKLDPGKRYSWKSVTNEFEMSPAGPFAVSNIYRLFSVPFFFFSSSTPIRQFAPKLFSAD